MDFENAENLQDEAPPPILSPEIREVFHVFANMLDIKSFMRLAMTSTEMYDRCMEDKMISINVKEKEVSVEVVNGVRAFSFDSFCVSKDNREKYLEKLRQLKCNVSLTTIRFLGDETDADAITETRSYLERLGMKKIDSLHIDGEFTGWQHISFIKDFHVRYVDIDDGLPDDVLRSLLQLNLNSFTYYGSVQGDLLLQVDSPVPKIELINMNLSTVVFTEILGKIQTGSLKTLIVHYGGIPWDNFTYIGKHHDEPIPEQRPLLVKNDEEFKDLNCWFLHWNGNVTICEEDDRLVKFFKCDRFDVYNLPPSLQSKERLHMALAEKSGRIECLKSHFISFFDGFPMVDEFHEGPLPEERPLICKVECDDGLGWLQYSLINEDGSIDVYCWDEGNCEWEKYNLEDDSPTVRCNLPLLKHLLKKRIEKPIKKGSFELIETEYFLCIFEDYETLPHDFRGRLPERRPLIFESAFVSEDGGRKRKAEQEDYRVVLYEDGIPIQYRLNNDSVYIGPCAAWNLPSTIITPEDLAEIVLNAPLKKFIYNIDLDVFRDAEVLNGPSVDAFDDSSKERPLVFKEIEGSGGEVVDTRWIVLENGDVRMCEWKEGRATFSRGVPREFPLVLTKSLVTDFFKGKPVKRDRGFYIDRDSLNQCLENYEILSYDYDGPLPKRSPLIFKKTEVKHTCQRKSSGGCHCVEEILHFCFVSEEEGVLHITWGVDEDRFLSFNDHSDPNNAPAVLKTKNALEFLLMLPWNSKPRTVPWYGSITDCVRYFDGQKLLDIKKDTPRACPLVYKEYGSFGRPSLVYWFLRQDDLLIRCARFESHFLLTISPRDCPPF